MMTLACGFLSRIAPHVVKTLVHIFNLSFSTFINNLILMQVAGRTESTVRDVWSADLIDTPGGSLMLDTQWQEGQSFLTVHTKTDSSAFWTTPCWHAFAHSEYVPTMSSLVSY